MFGICNDSKVLIARFAAPMTVRSNQPIYSSDTLSLKRHITRRSAQRWEISTNVEPLTKGANDLFVNLITKGYDTNLIVLMPQNYGVIKSRVLTNTTVAANGLANATSINITANPGTMPKGTFFSTGVAPHTKVYMTLTDLSNTGSVSIYPPLRANLSGEINIGNNVIGYFKYDLDTVIGMSYSDGILMDNGVIKLVEAI
jgi:hypothetical protein